MENDTTKSLMKNLEYFKYKRNVVEVFRNCIEYVALRVAKHVDIELDKDLIEKFDNVFVNYNEDERKMADNVCKDISILLSEFAVKYDDYLGNIYMQVIKENSKPQLGQFFTPYHVSQLMSKLSLSDVTNSKKRPIVINEPCCGSGGMCVACLETLNEQNINYATDALIYANDIDETCVYMTYLQLCFCGAAAVVEQKDTLTQKKTKELKTLGYYIQRQYYKMQNNADME